MFFVFKIRNIFIGKKLRKLSLLNFGMRLFLIVVIIGLAFPVDNHEVVVEHKYQNRINASTIADAVKIIDLEKDYHNVSHFVITDDYLIVAPGEEHLKGFSASVVLFTKEGRFIEELYRDKSIVQGLAYDPVNEQLYIGHADRIAVYDIVNRRQKGELEVKNGLSNVTFADGRIYVGTTKFETGKKTYLIEAYDSKDHRPLKVTLEAVYKTGEAHPAASFVARRNSFSGGGGSLYISYGETNDIYSSGNDFKSPVVSFQNLYESSDGALDIFLSSHQGIVGKFATTSFRHKGKHYLLFYDLKDKKQYLSESTDKSGLYDDYNHSGFYTPKFTNLNSAMYAYANKGKQTSIVLFHIKP